MRPPAMRSIRALLIACIAVVLLWAGWHAFTLGRRIASDRLAANALKARLLEGERLVPTHRSRDLRGEETVDYWCFSDDLCFYPLARFRVLYPAYNDLEDDVLIKEISGKLAP
jgi:hypothetical protein